MPLVGRDSLVAAIPHHPHHEPEKSYLLGPLGSERHQVIASAEGVALGQGMEPDVAHDDTDELDISSEDNTSENMNFPTFPSGSHRSLLLSPPRKFLSGKTNVSSTILSFTPHRACQPRLNI